MAFGEIIIEQDGVKRRLAGSFRLCTDPETARVLVKELNDKFAQQADFIYGWQDIHLIGLPSTPSTPPKEWTES